MPKHDPRESKKAGMVGWYDPLVFLLTGIDNLISNVFGQRSDFRQIEALTSQASEVDQTYLDAGGQRKTPTEQLYYDFRFHYRLKEGGAPSDGVRPNWYAQDEAGRYLLDETKPREEIWIDYVADVGDGWDSTYAVAYYLTQPVLRVAGRPPRPAAPVETRRGEVLIFGGDQVYPTADPKSYQRRLVAPYESALPEARPQPFLFATPGNHDWFDSLVSFTSLFCAGEPFAGWLTRQSRSYFALRLPHKWWFVGLDLQLSADLDGGQLRFFKKLAAEMEDGDRLIIGLPEPQWVHAKLHREYGEKYLESSLRNLVEQVFGRRVRVSVLVAGDLHHYRRHEAADRTQLITAGGGGAFLHPTHRGLMGVNFDTIEEAPREGGDGGGREFKLQAAFPDEPTSRRLCWRNLYFSYTNWRFGLLTALLYWLTSWVLVPIVVRHVNRFDFATLFSAMFPNPAVAFWLGLTFVAMVVFTDTRSLTYRLVAGGLHGLAHFLAALALSFGACWLVTHAGDDIKPWLKSAYYGVCGFGWCGAAATAFKLLAKHTAIAALIALGGLVVGPFLMGLYLLLSLNVFGRHYNEAFAALRIPDWKNFLRMRIDKDGGLTIYPVGIEKVPRSWEPNGDAARHPTAKFVPRAEATPPHLIEEPIRLRG